MNKREIKNSMVIKLDSIDKVKAFVHTVKDFDLSIDMTSGRYVIDAKSIMGIFSLDLSKPVVVVTYEDSEESEAMFDSIAKFA